PSTTLSRALVRLQGRRGGARHRRGLGQPRGRALQVARGAERSRRQRQAHPRLPRRAVRPPRRLSRAPSRYSTPVAAKAARAAGVVIWRTKAAAGSGAALFVRTPAT